jgi:hypothetical protein
MCKAAAEMLQVLQDTQILYSVAWSRCLPPSQDVAQISPIPLEKETSRYLQEAAQYLEKTADKDLEEDRTLRGSITNLSFEKPTDGTITISTEEWGKVSFSAKPDEYIAACSTRGEGQVISITGKLVKQGRRKPWRLLNPHNFYLQ